MLVFVRYIGEDPDGTLRWFDDERHGVRCRSMADAHDAVRRITPTWEGLVDAAGGENLTDWQNFNAWAVITYERRDGWRVELTRYIADVDAPEEV